MQFKCVAWSSSPDNAREDWRRSSSRQLKRRVIEQQQEEERRFAGAAPRALGQLCDFQNVFASRASLSQLSEGLSDALCGERVQLRDRRPQLAALRHARHALQLLAAVREAHPEQLRVRGEQVHARGALDARRQPRRHRAAEPHVRARQQTRRCADGGLIPAAAVS